MTENRRPHSPSRGFVVCERQSLCLVRTSAHSKMAGLERTFEQTFQLGTILTPLPSRSQDNPCFNILPDSTTQYDKITKEQSMTVRAEVPSDALYGTGKIEISVIGEPLGHILLDLPSKGIAKMVEHHPIGCGEQSMMRIGPLVYATLYLREINHIQHETETVEIVTKGILHMNKFRNETSGAYSTWTGKAPSTWLTAYVAKVFAQAFEVTEVNGTLASTICRSAMFVTSRQKSDGCFDDPLGIVMDESIAGGVDSITLMTAYVTVALLEVQNRLKTSRCAELPSVIDKAVEYLVGRSDEITDSYTLSMMAYGLLMSRNQRAKGEELLTRLLTTAVSNNDKNWKHWSIPRSSLTRKLRIRLIRNPVLTMEIETAAYALLALLEANKLSEASSVAMWLTSQHHSNGRFISTQDTVIALQALTLYRSKVYSTELEQDIKVQQIQPLSPHIDSIRLTNNARNLRHTYTYDLSKSQKDVLIQLDGKGEVRVEAVCTYNTLQNTDTCPFSLTTTILLPKDVSSGNTCYKYMGDSSSCVQTCYRYENSSGTNMAILYIGLHHLHKPNMANLNHIVNENENVDHVETTDKAVIFYLTQVPNVTHCVEFAVTPSSALPLNTMPVAVHLYDYHDPERLQCERFYQPNADVYSNKDKPIEYTYIKNNNEFVCGEEPQPPVHDYMKGNSAPVNSSDLEELLCNAVSPVNVYALNVTFLLDGDRFWDEHDADTGHIAYFVHAKVNKVLKKGSLPEPMHEEVRFYVQRSWSDFEEWAKDYKDHPHVIIGTDYEDHKGQTEIWLHLDKGDVYLQRLAPHKPWVSPQTRVAWKNLPRETRQMGRKNQRYLLNFNACKV